LSEVTHCVPTSATVFFREMHHFQFLAQTVVSDLRAGASIGRAKHVRIWSAACSTGEEPYSIAISLLEAFGDAASSQPICYQPGGWRIQVIASDSDRTTLAAAMERIYQEESLREAPAQVKERYFLRGRGNMAGRVRVKQGVAELVHFQPFHLQDSHWPIEGPFDVIFFRDTLGVLPRTARERILREMLCYLVPHGYLILGSSEQVPWLKDAVVSMGKGVHQLRPRGKAKYTGNERRNHPRKVRSFE